MTKKEIFLISLALFMFSLIITIILYVNFQKQEINFEIVNCKVVEVEEKRKFLRDENCKI